ncbi:2',3'-cyclic-nucleotide 2'-phosphodiesterase (5'-nucleotidase family) [Roseivirga pacifica]|uniref:2',3'-cyclic-nucleotide 2'-phosphodiesterase/5'-or 3'-nucleotidase, 5'-nucleotidase family n=1 Tax=Roseivirga pacifica TaxID=1267423 RepID=A0A1I0M855_9BACT|nr:bifunctional metallophosphatase/5'-nucleotidase [Roseivirga pacifica]RKQ50085.1 2',3'-cyclic-nucleotide 2'-phosphodiesterase (5'-nucleotidase family) [Roseivirga pacifica]SEV83561.1 2',3'-cyclic-nucleotide 2'-phosphodiesterase/5'-or 3'-nucleotidase, 5'-nucleotidase family [Roseivirga pacifica]
MKNQLFLFSFLSLFLFACQDQKVEFIILQMNDVYEIAPLEGGKVAGMARVATVRKQLLQENPNVITTLSGDFVSPSLIGTLKYDGQRIAGKQMVEVMNAVGVDYVVPGNHEYDINEDEIQARINESSFEWTTTNVFHVVNGKPVPWEKNGTPFPDHIMYTIDGVDIAFFGSTVPFNKKDYVSYTDKYESVKTVYEKVKDEAEIFIGITHLEEEMDDSLATHFVPQFDLILGGHDHANMKFQFGETVMTKADANAKTVYVHRISYDKATGETSINSELVNIDDSIAEDAEVKQVVDKWVNISNESMAAMGYTPNEVVMITSDTLDGRESSIRYKPTNYPIMTAESFLFAVPDADLAVFNSGSIRLDDQLTGTITEYDILRSFPFGGGVSIVSLKGNVIERILETGTVTNVGIGGYLQLVNAEKKADGWYIKQKKLSTSKSYKLVLPQFVMNGGEKNLEFLANYASSAQSPETFGNVKNDVRDIIMAYFRAEN